MFGARTINRHARLVSAMGETLGLDLGGSIDRGSLPAGAWRGAVLRCTGCSDPDGCESWLAEHHETGAAAPPGFCRNGDMMARLKLPG